MGLWGAIIAYQLLLATGVLALTQQGNSTPENHNFKSWSAGAIDIVMLLNNDDNDDVLIQGIKHHLNLVAHHKICGTALVLVNHGNQQVKLTTLSKDFEDILQAMGSKSNRACMYIKSFTNFIEERQQFEFQQKKTVTVEEMVDIQTAKQSIILTSMNTIGLCRTKENVLEYIAN
eukprot:634569-Ditylum_brightwellii.AAC.1